jgi:creatinine amidohydrolase
LPLPSKYWAQCSTVDLSATDLSQVVAVLPLGATEQHGPHLPLSVDTCIANAIVQSTVDTLPKDFPTLFLPTQTIGLSPEHAAFAGTLTLKPETVMRLWTDIAECAHAAGIRKLVLFNAHGGHVGMMDVVARDLRARLGLLVYSINWYQLPLLDEQGRNAMDLFSAHEQRFGIHAGDVETSLMLTIDPARVNMAQAQMFASTSEQRAAQYPLIGNGSSAKLAWQMQDYNHQGAVGNAAAATADKGRALLTASAKALAQALDEIHRLPVGTIVK